jgi:hypothetical protein
MSELRCPYCNAVLRHGNPGPFCSAQECVRAMFSLQAYLSSEIKGALATVQISHLSRDADGIYTVWCSYPAPRRGEVVRLEGVRYNGDGVGVGQHVTLGMGGAKT